MATKINFRLGYTINTGDYESVRLDLGIEDDKREGESIGEAYKRVRDFVEKTMGEEVTEIRSELKRR